MLQTLLKIIVTLAVILAAVYCGRKWPTLGGLIATMPLTGLLVMLWLYFDNPQSPKLMADYTRGAVLGIIPTILFFLTAYLCFRRQCSLPVVLGTSFAVWTAGALLHQWLLK